MSHVYLKKQQQPNYQYFLPTVWINMVLINFPCNQTKELQKGQISKAQTAHSLAWPGACQVSVHVYVYERPACPAKFNLSQYKQCLQWWLITNKMKFYFGAFTLFLLPPWLIFHFLVSRSACNIHLRLAKMMWKHHSSLAAISSVMIWKGWLTAVFLFLI